MAITEKMLEVDLQLSRDFAHDAHSHTPLKLNLLTSNRSYFKDLEFETLGQVGNLKIQFIT